MCNYAGRIVGHSLFCNLQTTEKVRPNNQPTETSGVLIASWSIIDPSWSNLTLCLKKPSALRAKKDAGLKGRLRHRKATFWRGAGPWHRLNNSHRRMVQTDFKTQKRKKKRVFLRVYFCFWGSDSCICSQLFSKFWRDSPFPMKQITTVSIETSIEPGHQWYRPNALNDSYSKAEGWKDQAHPWHHHRWPGHIWIATPRDL